jgi:hypothetical protein
MLELARSFVALPSRKHQEAICYLVRSMAHPDQIDDLDHAMLLEDEGAVPA